MSSSTFNHGFTLVEVLTVITLISLIAIVSVGTVTDHAKQIEVNKAIGQAREIAYVIHRLRSTDVSPATVGVVTLREYRSALVAVDANLPGRHFPALNSGDTAMDVSILDFYRVETSAFSVFVSFTLPLSLYGDLQVDRAVRQLDVDAGTVTWTVMQQEKSGLASAYAAASAIYSR